MANTTEVDNANVNRLPIWDLDQGGLIYGEDSESCLLTRLTFIFSTIGIILSAFSILLLLLTALLFSEWRKNYKNKLLIQCMIARFLYSLMRYFNDLTRVFGFAAPAAREESSAVTVNYNWFLMVSTEMAMVCWMFVFSRKMYDSLVKVFYVDDYKLWMISLSAWLFPVLIGLVMQVLFMQEKNVKFYIVYLILIKWPVQIANAILLIASLKSILTINKSRSENNIRIIFVILFLIFVFCFQQILEDIGKLIYIILLYNYMYMSKIWTIYSIIGLFYCAFATLFWLFGNAETRKLWKFRRKSYVRPLTLDCRISMHRNSAYA